MKVRLRIIASSLMALTALFNWAQAPTSGTYKIRSSQGTYVQIKGKYYAKPDANESEASTIGVGIGYKDATDGGLIVSTPSRVPTLKMAPPSKSTTM